MCAAHTHTGPRAAATLTAFAFSCEYFSILFCSVSLSTVAFRAFILSLLPSPSDASPSNGTENIYSEFPIWWKIRSISSRDAIDKQTVHAVVIGKSNLCVVLANEECSVAISVREPDAIFFNAISIPFYAEFRQLICMPNIWIVFLDSRTRKIWSEYYAAAYHTNHTSRECII